MRSRVLPRPAPRPLGVQSTVQPLVPPPRSPERFPECSSDGAFELPQVLAAVRAAAPQLGLPRADVGRARVVQLLSTAVLQARGLAVKVYPPGTDPSRLVAQAGALEAAPELWVRPVAGPVATAAGVVTAYPWVPAAAPVGWPEVGALLRQWHAADVPTDGLPAWAPLHRLPGQVEAYAALPGADRGLVRVALSAREHLLEQVAGLESVLGTGVIHGDVSPSNVLRRGGRPVLIDSDFVAVGPKEYGLVPAAQRRERGELDEAEYLDFCAAYGHDVRSWPGLGLIEEICSLGAVTFRLWCAARRGEDVSWLDRALARYA